MAVRNTGPHRLRDKAYERIKTAVIKGEYEPGDVLYETVLAKELGMSRTPVREALMLLVREDLLKDLPSGGALVTPATIEEINEIFELRLCLERYVIEEVLARDLPLNLEHLKEILNEQATALEEGNLWGFFNANRFFHNEVVGLLGNNTLANVMHGLRDKPLQSGFRAYRNRANISDAIAEHQAIIEALENRDPEAALKAVTTHVLNAKHRLYHG